MNAPEYDVVIIGAGPVGSALALLLARHATDPGRIALIGKRIIGAGAAPTSPAGDPRTLALNHGSRALLEDLNVWPTASASIDTVHVSQRGRLGRTVIRHADLGVSRLGSVVAYDMLLTTLHRALTHSGIDLIEAPHMKSALSGRPRFDLGDRTLTSTLAVQSDGARPAGIARDYRQHAVVSTVRASRPRAGWAFERFTRHGPLAVLPHPHGNDLYGIVWCCSPEQARRLQQLDAAAFAIALHDMFGDRLGRFDVAGDRHVFPLSLHAGPALVGPHTVAIGNAAQTLHPVAGQGLNLGLRDAAQLSHTLMPWLDQSHIDVTPLLARYARQRCPDRLLTAALTDFLPRIFATSNPVIQHACGLSLLALDLIPTLRTPLARHLLHGLRI